MCQEMLKLERPIWLAVGRVCREKNFDELLDIAQDGGLPGTVCLVGIGGELEAYKCVSALGSTFLVYQARYVCGRA